MTLSPKFIFQHLESRTSYDIDFEVHVPTFIDAHEGEQGAEGGIEEKVKQLGHDKGSRGWIGEAAGKEGGGTLGDTRAGFLVLIGIYPIIFVEARCFITWQSLGWHVDIAQGLGTHAGGLGGHGTL